MKIFIGDTTEIDEAALAYAEEISMANFNRKHGLDGDRELSELPNIRDFFLGLLGIGFSDIYRAMKVLKEIGEKYDYLLDAIPTKAITPGLDVNYFLLVRILDDADEEFFRLITDYHDSFKKDFVETEAFCRLKDVVNIRRKYYIAEYILNNRYPEKQELMFNNDIKSDQISKKLMFVLDKVGVGFSK